MDKLLNISEAAALLKVSKSLLYELAGKRLPCVRIGKRILFIERRLETFIEEHSIEPGANHE